MDPNRKKIIVYCLVGAIILSVIYAMAQPGSRVGTGAQTRTLATGGDQIGVIYIEGEIVGGRSTSGMFGSGIGSDTVINYIRQAEQDPTVKALVIRINSPGGSPAASDEISRELKKFRSSGRKVVASMSDVAASGAYWVAANCDRIWASPGTMTGSIGVIWELTRLDELYKKIGVQVDVVKSGPFKDIGSSARALTSEERKILQSMVDDIFDQFITTVAEGRKLKREDVVKLADGRIFTGRQAKDNGLVDELGNMFDAVNGAAKLANVRSWRVKEYGRTTTFERLISQLSQESSTGAGQFQITGNPFRDAIWLLREIVITPGLTK